MAVMQSMFTAVNQILSLQLNIFGYHMTIWNIVLYTVIGGMVVDWIIDVMD